MHGFMVMAQGWDQVLFGVRESHCG